MNQKLGHQVLPDFLQEIAKDRAIQPRGWGITANYFELGLYDEQVSRFLAVFPKTQIKILKAGIRNTTEETQHQRPFGEIFSISS